MYLDVPVYDQESHGVNAMLDDFVSTTKREANTESFDGIDVSHQSDVDCRVIRIWMTCVGSI